MTKGTDGALKGLEIALVRIHFDGGVSNRPGTHHGPRKIRNQSTIMCGLHHLTRLDPFAQRHIADIGNVRFSFLYHFEQVSNDIAACYSVVHQASLIPLSAGDDYSITYPILPGLAADGPAGLIHIYAHAKPGTSFRARNFTTAARFKLIN
jgi:guanidinopropionase